MPLIQGSTISWSIVFQKHCVLSAHASRCTLQGRPTYAHPVITASVHAKVTGSKPASFSLAPLAFVLRRVSASFGLHYCMDNRSYFRTRVPMFGWSMRPCTSRLAYPLNGRVQERLIALLASRRASVYNLQRRRKASKSKVDQNRVPLLGRSAYYGVFAYISALTGSFWLLAIMQAAVVGCTVLLLATDLGGDGKRKRLGWAAIILLLLAGTTTAPFFTSFVMPDVSSGIAIIAAAMLMFSPLTKPQSRNCLVYALHGGGFVSLQPRPYFTWHQVP